MELQPIKPCGMLVKQYLGGKLCHRTPVLESNRGHCPQLLDNVTTKGRIN